MSSAKLMLAAAAAALSLAACGASAKPEAGTLNAVVKTHKGIDDPRATHVACLRSDHIPVTKFGHWWLQIGTKPYGPTVHFAATPGAAQELQIDGQIESAEIIGAALLYPNQAPGGLLSQVEACVAKGVTG